MAYRKKANEIQLIREGGAILGRILSELESLVKPGISLSEIDRVAEEKIIKAGGLPAFKGYRAGGNIPFPATICGSLNSEVVHGIPTEKKIIKNGDLVKIDIGMQYPANSGLGEKGNGFFTDTALTVAVGRQDKKVYDLLEVTKESLYAGIRAGRIGLSVFEISSAIEKEIRARGDFGIVRDLSGHGVGHKVHESPYVPNYKDKSSQSWIIEDGVVLALEPMVNMGDYRVKMADDGWTIMTADGSLSAHFEHTIIFTKDGPVIATLRPDEDFVL